ncbi:MAG: Plug domain-containing protein, partial [Halieaceae bacterium]|nr:Plug domain-containing protein [Halieaceae bacterium]
MAAQAPEEILVTGQRVASGSDADPELIKALDSVPGGTNLITPASKTQLTTLSDLFAYEPGVVVQEFFGGFDQPRLNIRGSGLQSNPVSRGVLLLQDYLPLNDADGSFIIGLIQPLATRTMTVQRGANSRVPGAVTLGG